MEAVPARQLGVKNPIVEHLVFRVFWSNRHVLRLLLKYGVNMKCHVLFDKRWVYFVVTDTNVANVCSTSIAIHALIGKTVPPEDLRKQFFAEVMESTGCVRISMTEQEYNALASASDQHMHAFFRHYMPTNEDYEVYLCVCKFFGVTPYTSSYVVNAIWSLALTLQGALL
jgi:hypothetical protein